MKKLLMILIVIGMLIGTGGCNHKVPANEPVSVNNTPECIVPDKYGIIWKIGYVPAKAVHEFGSGIWYGLRGTEPVSPK